MNLKKAGYKLLTYLPGVGLIAYSIKEYKTRKEKSPWYNIKDPKDRKALAIYPLEVGYFVLSLSWKIWLGNGIDTGEWNPLHYFKSEKNIKKTEKPIEKKSLEDSIKYYDLLK